MSYWIIERDVDGYFIGEGDNIIEVDEIVIRLDRLNLLERRSKERGLKLARQAEQITRLEASRRTLREQLAEYHNDETPRRREDAHKIRKLQAIIDEIPSTIYENILDRLGINEETYMLAAELDERDVPA